VKGTTQVEARKQLRALQSEHGDTFTPEFTIKLGRLWEAGCVVVEDRLKGDYTLLMTRIHDHVNLFVYGTQRPY
jgi:hypothetical protein